MSLHNEFYEFRDKVWKEFERIVQEGCDIAGQIPIVVGEYSMPPNGLRIGSVHLTDVTNLSVSGIFSNPDYAIFPPKENEKDIIVSTNRITVLVKNWDIVNGKFVDMELDVEPDILDLQALSTYVSGGWECYNKSN